MVEPENLIIIPDLNEMCFNLCRRLVKTYQPKLKKDKEKDKDRDEDDLE